MKILPLLESRQSLPPEIEALVPAVLAAAQRVYDDWDENEDEYAGGGICHLIADEISGVFAEHDFETMTQSAHQGEQHVWANILHRVQREDGEEDITVYEVDIPPGVYENGGGYSWTKIQGVTFTRNELIIEPICRGEHCIADYFSDDSY